MPIQKASSMGVRHRERHRTERIGWLRATVLGANDGIISTASLLLGVSAAKWGAMAMGLTAGVGMLFGIAASTRSTGLETAKPHRSRQGSYKINSANRSTGYFRKGP